jgi:hypothetical protein
MCEACVIYAVFLVMTEGGRRISVLAKAVVASAFGRAVFSKHGWGIEKRTVNSKVMIAHGLVCR